MQKAENNAYQQRVNADIQHRVDRLPAFNSVYDMNRLSMNTYNQPDTKREIARRWSETFNNTLNYT
ncbi:MAG TPA: hypothetical protein DD435_03885 [Cyanobacteria bacterium UBA8530]|nr:hypothetical protein [Cyanobacteria bacterium UBA8530]